VFRPAERRYPWSGLAESITPILLPSWLEESERVAKERKKNVCERLQQLQSQQQGDQIGRFFAGWAIVHFLIIKKLKHLFLLNTITMPIKF
jgi:hypothetical protein